MRTRVATFSVLSLLGVIVVCASLAWACTEPGYGTPSNPPPPSSDPAEPAPATAPSEAPASPPAAEQAPANTSAPAQVTAPATASAPATAKATTTGAVHAKTHAAPTKRPVVPTTGQAQLVARERGATAGTVQVAGQTVFRSSTAPKHAKAHAPAKHHAQAKTPAPAPQPVTGDAWARQPATSLAAADALGGGGASGPRAEIVLGLLILGVGLAGLTGTFAVATARRRRAVLARRR